MIIPYKSITRQYALCDNSIHHGIGSVTSAQITREVRGTANIDRCYQLCIFLHRFINTTK